jgi:Bacterial Ig-like domain
MLWACARPVVPTGGPKDSKPPAVDTTKSTPNLSANFSNRLIELTFDEWVVLEEVATRVIISPPLAKRPEITLKGKTVRIALDKAETFRPNTTYTINFGEAIKDLHEGNAAKDLRFVFSTGPVIDSLTLTGSVVDAQTNEFAENILIALYDDQRDSVIRKEKPYYIARTDKSGQFTIPNLRAAPFKAVAFEDINQNLRWDGDGERIAFMPKPVQTDTVKNMGTFRLFKNKPSAQRLIDKNVSKYGVVKLLFSQPPSGIKLRTDSISIGLRTEAVLDTLLVWYDLKETRTTPWQLFVNQKDTVAVRNHSRDNFLARHRLRFADAPAVVLTANQQRNRGSNDPATPPPAAATLSKILSVTQSKPIVLQFNAPITSMDTSRWIFEEDSIRCYTLKVRRDTATPRDLQLEHKWRDGKTTQLTLLPGALTDFWNTTNKDTLRISFNIVPEKQLGNLILSITKLKKDQNYVLQLLDNNNVEQERRFKATGPGLRLDFKRLTTTTFTVRLIEDVNNNGRWDSGSYFERRLPEPLFLKKLESLRANWDLEASMVAE